MKKIALFYFLLLANLCNGQFGPHPPGSINTNSLLNPFLGNWKWTSVNDTVQFYLEKQLIYFEAPLDYQEEVLVGWHKYVKNGILIESSMQFAGSPYIIDNSTLLGVVKVANKAYFTSFHDLTKDKGCDLYLNYIQGALPKVTWLLRESRGLKSDGYSWGFTLPNNITLTKQ